MLYIKEKDKEENSRERKQESIIIEEKTDLCTAIKKQAMTQSTTVVQVWVQVPIILEKGGNIGNEQGILEYALVDKTKKKKKDHTIDEPQAQYDFDMISG